MKPGALKCCAFSLVILLRCQWRAMGTRVPYSAITIMAAVSPWFKLRSFLQLACSSMHNYRHTQLHLHETGASIQTPVEIPRLSSKERDTWTECLDRLIAYCVLEEDSCRLSCMIPPLPQSSTLHDKSKHEMAWPQVATGSGIVADAR